MKFRVVALLLALVSLCGVLAAQDGVAEAVPPTREQVQKLLQIVGIEHHLDTMLEQRQSKVREGARGCFRDMNPGADDATLKRLDAAFANTPLITSADFSDGLITELQRRLSAAEVQAGIDFYGSEAGRSLTQKMPVILQNLRVSIGPVVEKKLQAYTNALNRTLMDFQNEMNQRKPQPPFHGGAGDSSQTMHAGSI
jgi:hypothetical protein